MPVNYSILTINARLQAVADTIDAVGSGYMLLKDAGGTLLSTIQLPVPCGQVNAGVLTFTGTMFDPATTGTGLANEGFITDASGALVVSGLNVGIPLSGADIELFNGHNTTQINAGQTLQVLSAQITGA